LINPEHKAVGHTPLDSGKRSAKTKQDQPQADIPVTALPLMMFLLAKGNRQLAGYELLQAVLAAGLRFGEGQLFHRHQHTNGQGPILCSLAAATDEGVFDLQNIGAFSVRGLCLYMHQSGNSGIDAERFDIMLDTAKTLSEDLDAYLLDDRRKPLSDGSIQRYHQRLNLIEEAVS
jgi:cell division protein ZipA